MTAGTSGHRALANDAIIVLGMHRSGTSAMAGVLAYAGVDFGDRLYTAQEHVNDRGFWEHGPIVDCHDELLLELASSWDDPRPLPDNWLHRTEVAQYRKRLNAAILRDFDHSVIWGLKNPRICRVLPLWQEIFRDLRVEPRYVIMVRNPLEVAASLNKRNGFSRDKSLFLWWQHQALAEAATRGSVRLFVAYDDLLANPWGILEEIADTLGISWPIPREEIMPAVSNFLSTELRHHHDLNFTSRNRVEMKVAAAYQDYCRATGFPAQPLDETCLLQHADAFFQYVEDLDPILIEHLAAISRDSRRAHLTLKQYYDCYMVKLAKRFCMLEQRAASLLGSRR